MNARQEKFHNSNNKKRRLTRNLNDALDNFLLPSGNRRDHPFRGSKVPTASSGRSAIRRRESDQSRVVSAELIGGIGSFRNATLAASGSHFSRNVIRETETYAISSTHGFGGQHGRRGPCDRASARCNGTSRPPVAAPTKKKKQALEPERFRKGPELAHLRRVQADLDQSGPTVVGVGHHAGCRGDSDPTRSHH